MFRAAARVYKDGELRGARRRGHARPLRPRPMPDADCRGRDAAPHERILRRALRPAGRSVCACPRAPSGGRNLSRPSHARADRQRRRHRRHVRGSLRHARDRDCHHRADSALGAAGGADDDGLRHLGHRLRLRGGGSRASSQPARRRTGAPACACCCSPSRPRNCRSSCRIASVNACSPARARPATRGSTRATTGSSSAMRSVSSATAGRSPSASAPAGTGACR